MLLLRKVTLAAAFAAVILVALWYIPRELNPTPPSPEEARRDKIWVESSPYWLDRQICRYIGVCGLTHIKWDPPSLGFLGGEDNGRHEPLVELKRTWLEVEEELSWMTAPEPGESKKQARLEKRDEGRVNIPTDPSPKIQNGDRKLQVVPEYVLAHAPLVHLYSGENFWPSHIGEHLEHMVPYLDGAAMNLTTHVNLTNLNTLNINHSHHEVYLTSADDVEARPHWLHSLMGVPTASEDHDGDWNPADHNEEWRLRDRQRPVADGTTWWDTDKEHPPQRISDPRKLQPDLRKRALYEEDQKPISRTKIPEQKLINKTTMKTESFYQTKEDSAGDDNEGTHRPDAHGYSKAPAVLVLVDKGNGILDAFWFFFYSYNLGQTVLKIRFGNHVGDWEHCMTRFENGIPRAMFLSEHAGGKAYAWQAMEKVVPPAAEPRADGKRPARPIIYSAVGSHAMYALPGSHPYVLPFGLLADVTDPGPLWDPSLNHLAYWFDYELGRENATQSLTPAATNPDAETAWFHFNGPWGDALYGLFDIRQWRLFGQYHYVEGPYGPKFKHLGRRKVCQTKHCRILYSLEEGQRSSWYN